MKKWITVTIVVSLFFEACKKTAIEETQQLAEELMSRASIDAFITS